MEIAYLLAPVALFDPTDGAFFLSLTSNLNFLPCSLSLLPLSLSLWTSGKWLAPFGLCPPKRYWTQQEGLHLDLWLRCKPSSLWLSLYGMCLRSFNCLGGLHWTHSSISMSFLYWRVWNWTQFPLQHKDSPVLHTLLKMSVFSIRATPWKIELSVMAR